MNVDSICGNLIAAVIYGVAVWVLKQIWNNRPRDDGEPPKKAGSKAVLKKQFFASLIILVISLAVYCSIGFHPGKLILSFLRPLFGLSAGFSFIIVWGAFEAAFAFYPPDDPVEVPPDQGSDQRSR